MPKRRAQVDRRQFVASSLAAAAATAALPLTSGATEGVVSLRPYCTFVKYLTSLSYGDLATAIAEAGFDGVEVPIRAKDGYIKPDQVEEELPKFVRALEAKRLKITILT